MGEVVDAHVLEEEVVVSCTVRAFLREGCRPVVSGGGVLLVRQGWCGVVGCPCCVVTQVADPPTPVTKLLQYVGRKEYLGLDLNNLVGKRSWRSWSQG